MKKFLFSFIVLVLLITSAAADPVDLSGMSFDELVALRDQLNLAIWNSQEWQEVTVPVRPLDDQSRAGNIYNNCILRQAQRFRHKLRAGLSRLGWHADSENKRPFCR